MFTVAFKYDTVYRNVRIVSLCGSSHPLGFSHRGWFWDFTNKRVGVSPNFSVWDITANKSSSEFLLCSAICKEWCVQSYRRLLRSLMVNRFISLCGATLHYVMLLCEFFVCYIFRYCSLPYAVCCIELYWIVLICIVLHCTQCTATYCTVLHYDSFGLYGGSIFPCISPRCQGIICWGSVEFF